MRGAVYGYLIVRAVKQQNADAVNRCCQLACHLTNEGVTLVLAWRGGRRAAESLFNETALHLHLRVDNGLTCHRWWLSAKLRVQVHEVVYEGHLALRPSRLVHPRKSCCSPVSK